MVVPLLLAELSLPDFVQRAEWEAAHEPSYTVRGWLDFAGSNYQLLDGESEILPGLHIIPSPGHTPGHHDQEIWGQA